MDEDAFLSSVLEALANLQTITSSRGNYDYDEYMYGFANGVICAISVVTGQEPEYMEPPTVYIKNIKPESEPTLDGRIKYDA